MNNRKTLTLTVTAELQQALADRCRELDIPQSVFLRQALRSALATTTTTDQKELAQ